MVGIKPGIAAISGFNMPYLDHKGQNHPKRCVISRTVTTDTVIVFLLISRENAIKSVHRNERWPMEVCGIFPVRFKGYRMNVSQRHSLRGGIGTPLFNQKSPGCRTERF